MKYQIDKVGEPGHLYLEEQDLLAVKSCKDGTHAVELSVRYRKQYQAEGAFSWQGSDSEDLTLRLVARQAMEIVEQERKVQKAFCADCYDYGKSPLPPNGCVRCQLLEACRKSGQGDYRKVRPVAKSGQPSAGYGCGMLLLVLLWWWTLCQWAGAATQTDRLLHQLDTCKQVQH